MSGERFFNKDFNVQTNMRGYRRLIEELRDLPRSREAMLYTHNVPVLVPETAVPRQWLDLELRTRDDAPFDPAPRLTLRIRADNLYLVGYRTAGGAWFEFGETNEQRAQRRPPLPPRAPLIRGAAFLGFDGDYLSLDRRGGPLQGTRYGPNRLLAAVESLTNQRELLPAGEALVIMIVMFSESMRLTEVFYFMNSRFRHSNDAVIGGRLDDLIHNWRRLSRGLIQADLHRAPFPHLSDLHIDSADQASVQLGMVLYIYEPPGYTLRRGRRSTSYGDDGICPAGIPLVQVFQIRMLNIDGEDPGDLYGTVIVDNGLSRQTIYNRSRSSYESIRPGGLATLHGPSTAVSAVEAFTIELDLKDRDDDLSSDDEVSKGVIGWSPYSQDNRYNTPLRVVVSGRYGSAEVTYAVLPNAVEATLRVVLINGDGESPADVYGHITAASGDNPECKSVLFEKKENNPVRPSDDVPLLRPVVAVSLDSMLLVKAELWDHDPVSFDDPIAAGTARFAPSLAGRNSQVITGEYGSILVTVAWRVPLA